jgi:transposase
MEEGMLDMSQIDDIRKRYETGQSQRQIARETGLSRSTVAKYIEKDDFSPQVPQRKSRPSKLDPYKPLIASWLEEDKSVWRKQRHSAQRIYDRLRAETDFDGSYSIVQAYCGFRRIRTGIPELMRTAFRQHADTIPEVSGHRSEGLRTPAHNHSTSSLCLNQSSVFLP